MLLDYISLWMRRDLQISAEDSLANAELYAVYVQQQIMEVEISASSTLTITALQ